MNAIIQRNFLIGSVIDSGILNRPDAEQIRMAMVEYTKSLKQENARLRETQGSEAVEFGIWLSENCSLFHSSNDWCIYGDRKTTAEVYQLFLTSKNK